MDPLTITPDRLSITQLAGYFQPFCCHDCGDLCPLQHQCELKSWKL